MSDNASVASAAGVSGAVSVPHVSDSGESDIQGGGDLSLIHI